MFLIAATGFLTWLVLYALFHILTNIFESKPGDPSDFYKNKERRIEIQRKYAIRQIKRYKTLELKMSDLGELIISGVNGRSDEISEYGRVEIFGLGNTARIDRNTNLVMIPDWRSGGVSHVDLAVLISEYLESKRYKTPSNSDQPKPVHFMGIVANDDENTLVASCFLLPDNSVIVSRPHDPKGAYTHTYDPAQVPKLLIAAASKGLKEAHQKKEQAKKDQEEEIRISTQRKERDAAEGRQRELKKQKAIEALKRRM